MKLQSIDHLVLTVSSIEATVKFYQKVLGFEELNFGAGRRAVRCGSQKINLHQAGAELHPHAKSPTAGSGDICLIYAGTIEEITAHLAQYQVKIELGPVRRSGAVGAIESVYIRDPDENLIELSIYVEELD
jgi:catechol 2,3-dioxygenase-like lactoylglutathione lyase family enzyme